jgi:hypothetical protein
VESTIYYTFSTISQTLAGALGLLGAFVILRMSALNRLIEDKMDLLLKGPGEGYVDLMAARADGNSERFFKVITAMCEPGQPLDRRVSAVTRITLDQGRAMLGRKAKLLQDVRFIMVATAVCIVASMSALALTVPIASVPWLTFELLFFGVMSAAVCLGLQVRLMLEALQD